MDNEWHKSGKTGFLVIVGRTENELHCSSRRVKRFWYYDDKALNTKFVDMDMVRWEYARPATREDFILYEDLK